MRLKMAIALVFIVLGMTAGATLAQDRSPLLVNPDPECDTSDPVNQGPVDPVTNPFGGWWFREDGGELWANAAYQWTARSNKVGWHKPAGATITATGVRLDGEASPMIAHFPDGYSGNFQASGLYFPSEGCWEITAEADGSTLTFITYVYPVGYSYVPISCDNETARAIDESAAIVVGEFVGAASAPDPFVQQTIHVDDVIKGDVQVGERLDVLVNRNNETQFKIGGRYLLFLWQETDYGLRPYCQYAQIVDNQLVVNFDFGPVVDGQPRDEALESLRTALGDSSADIYSRLIQRRDLWIGFEGGGE
jgi:hypothetical protein